MKTILSILMLLTVSAMAQDTKISNLSGRATPFSTSDVTAWAIPGVSNYKMSWNDLTNDILSGMASQAYSQSVTSGYPWGVLYDAAGRAQAATNGFPWGPLYDASGTALNATNGLGSAAFKATSFFDAAGAGTTAATAATNGYVWGVLYDAAGTATLVTNIIYLKVQGTNVQGASSSAGQLLTSTGTGSAAWSNAPAATGASLNGTNVWTGTNTFTAAVVVTNTTMLITNPVKSTTIPFAVQSADSYLKFNLNYVSPIIVGSGTIELQPSGGGATVDIASAYVAAETDGKLNCGQAAYRWATGYFTNVQTSGLVIGTNAFNPSIQGMNVQTDGTNCWLVFRNSAGGFITNKITSN